MSSSRFPVLPIEKPEDEQIFYLAIHGRSGSGKSTAEIDILLWALENNLVEGIATNIQVTGVDNYQHIQYLTDLSEIQKKALGLDELNRALDGREWKDELRQRFTKIVDNSRRRQCKVVVATSIRETGIDRSYRLNVRMIIEPRGLMDEEGYPLYLVFWDYSTYERYLQHREELGVIYRGFHKVAELKKLFNSKEEPHLEAYPPIDVPIEAKKFVEWGGAFLYNIEGRLVALQKLRLHLNMWNLDTHEIPFNHRDSDKILSFLYQDQDSILVKEEKGQ